MKVDARDVMIDMVVLNNASFMSGATHHSKESISDGCETFGCCQRYGRGNRDAVAGVKYEAKCLLCVVVDNDNDVPLFILFQHRLAIGCCLFQCSVP
jgi:hypothetical protein